MNKTLSTILIVLAILVLAGAIFFFGTMFARASVFGPGMMAYAPAANASGPGYGTNNGSSYAPGLTPALAATPGVGQGGSYGMGPGMTFAPGASAGVNGTGANGWNNGTTSNVAPLTVDQAKQAAGNYIQSLGIEGLEIGEVMVFDNNAYVVVKETSTGLGAFELLVDPASQVAYPEYGPNMMWNLKYGGLNHSEMMSGTGAGAGGHGSMGGSAGMGNWNYGSTTPADVTADMPVTKDQAIQNAQSYLDGYLPGSTAANDPTHFYGYYTFDFSKDGKVAGMLSVNGFTGQVFLHTWHGTFIEEAQ